MAECKFCHGGIEWRKVEGKSVPYNLDGTLHRCKKEATPNGSEHAGDNIGRLDAYTTGSATFTVKDGSQKTYAITASMMREWQTAGFPQGTGVYPEVWLSIFLDKNHFVQSYKQIPKPEWSSKLPAPAAAPKEPTTTGMEKPAAPCTSPKESPKHPAQEGRFPTREELLAMVYDYNTYWKAKTIMDLIAHDEIRLQVEWKNWQECVNSAIVYEGDNTNLTALLKDAEDLHVFIQDKVKAGGARYTGDDPHGRNVGSPNFIKEM